MKKSVSSNNRKFSLTRIIVPATIILITAVFISALPTVMAQASNNSSFFGLGDLFGNTDNVLPSKLSNEITSVNSQTTDGNRSPDAVNNYTPARTTGITYSSISGTGTSVTSWRNGTSLDDNLSNTQPIGFTFIYNGGAFQNFRVSTNGFITFNTTSTATGGTASTPYNYENIGLSSSSVSTNFSPNVLAPMWDDLVVPTAGSLAGNIKYQTTGSVGSRILTVEWIGMELFSNAGPDMNWQVKLYEADGHIEYVYGTMSPGTTGSYTYSSGINASTVSAVPAAVELLTQQTANTATFSNTAQNTLGGANPSAAVPATNTQITFTPPATAPAAPTGLTFTGTGLTSTTLNWTDNATNETNYNVLISSDGGITYQTFGAVFAANTNSATITGLSAGTTYFFRVIATTEGVAGAPLDGSVTTNPPISGTKTIGPGGDYTTFAAAIADANAGTGAGGVTFNIPAGTTFAENGTCVTGGSSTNPIIFQKSGAGANPVIMPPGSTSTQDAGVCILGGDFITFNGIDVAVAVANTTVEYGYLIFNSSATNGAQNNTIQNSKITLNRTNTGSIGINQTLSVAATAASGANSTNKYYNITIENASRGILLNGTSSSILDTGNEIGTTSPTTFNVIGAATANDIGNGTAATYGIQATSQFGVKIFNTEIRNVTGTSTASVDGINLANLTPTISVGTNEIYNNLVHDIKSTSTSTTSHVVSGIRSNLSANAGSISKIYNNFVYGLDNQSTTATTRQIIGIRVQDGGGGAAAMQNIQNNSVRLQPTGIAASNSTFEIGSSSGPIMIVQNNNFANFTAAQSVSTALHYTWVTTSGTAIGAAGSSSNFNDLYVANAAAGSNGHVGRGNTTNYTTLANWQTATGQDASSISLDPLFGSATDLHIPFNSPAVDVGTTIAAITTDIDNQTRPNGAAYDIGADEYVSAVGTLQFSSAAYTGAEGATATITVSRVSGSSGAISVNYATGAGTATAGTCGSGGDYQNTSGTLNFANNVTSQTFTVQLCTDAVSPEINETVILTLSSPSGTSITGTNPATLTITDVPPPLSGNYTVGATGTYPTLTAAINALNVAGVSGPTTLSLTDAGYTTPAETFPLTINAIPGASATNTVTIKPNTGVSPSISGSSAGCVLSLNGADFVTIDGSNTVGSTTRDLTITNANAGTTSAVVCIQNTAALDGATNNVVKNTNIVGNTNLTTLFGVFSGGTTISATSVGTGNNTNTIQNNNLSKTQFGIYSQGASAANKNTGNVITQNLMNTASPNNVAKGGIQVGFENNVTISENNISGINTTTDDWGITLGLTSWTATTFTGNEVTNATVTRNNIGVVMNTGTNSAAGIAVASAASGTNLIANNFISGVTANSTPGDIAAGIFLGGGTGSTTNVYFNSVSMTGDRGTGTTASSLALAIGGTNPIVNARNNILYNTQTTVSTGRSYAIGTAYGPAGAANFSNLTSDNNDLFTSGANAGFSVITVLNSGTELTGLAAWQTATGKDAASVSGDPMFISTTNLHINTSATTVVSNAGTPISGITTDIDGDTRTATPDIGADEFMPPAGAGTLQFSAAAYTDTEGNNATITVSRVGGTTGAISVDYATSDGTANAGTCGSGGDYQFATGTLSFADTVSSQTFNVQLCNDASAEPSETVTLTLSNPTGTTITGTNPATLNITDNPPGTVQFSAATYSGNEGMTATITATRTGGGSGVVTVNYAASDGTATGGSCPGSDYGSTGGTLTWMNNDTASKTFTVQLCSDTVAEATETVNLTLSGVTGGATLGTAAATLSIFDVASQFCNADGAISIPTVGISTPYPSVINVSGLSGNTNTVRVTLNNAQHTDMTDLDILLVSPTGQKFILLSDASSNAGLDLPATLTFSDAGALLPTTGQVPSGTYQPRDVTAGDTFAAPAPAGPYVSPASVGTGTLNGTFSGANPNGAWNLYVVDDASGDTGTIGGWCLEITTVAVVVPTVDLSVDTNSASETGPTSVTVTATASSAVGSDQTVDLTVTGTGITAGDYTLSPTTITILSGQTTGTATFTVVDDALVEGTETATITEGNPSAGITLGTTIFQNVAVTDNDVANTPPTITPVGVTRQEGSPVSNSTIANVTDLESGNGAVVVTVTTANASNGVTISNIVNTGGVVTANVVAACGATSATFTLQASDGTLTSTATLNVTVTGNTAPTLTYSNASAAFNGSTTINPATGPSDNVSVAAVAVQSTGTYTGTISVNSAGVVSISNAAPAGTHTITIRATDNCGLTTDAAFQLTVDAAPTISLSVSSNTGSEAAATVITVTATLSGGTSATNQSVTLGTSGTATLGSDYTLAGGDLSGTTLTIPANATSGSTTFTVLDDVISDPSEMATLTISSPSSGITLSSPTSQTITIVDNDTAGVTVSPTTVNVTEGGATATYTVVLNTQPTANVTITITPDSQVSVNPTMLIFTTGNYNAPQMVTVTAVDDAVVEGNHTGTITQSAASADGNYNAISVAGVTANITDNDDVTAPTISYTAIGYTNSTANQTISATITDNVAVPTTGSFLPRVYYLKNSAAAYTSNACMYSGVGSSYDCMIDYAAIGGVVSGDSITYFIVAQDTSNNLSSNPSGATGSNVNSLTTGATAPNFYGIGTASSVPGGTYTNLNAGGSTLAGNVTVMSNLTLNGILNNGAFTLTLNPNATITRNSGYIIGNVTKVFSQLTLVGDEDRGTIGFIYPVGTANGYSPVTANNISFGGSGSSLSVFAKEGTQPNLNSATTLHRYWTLTKNGTLTADLQFNYNDGDVFGTESSYQVIRVEGGIPNFYTANASGVNGAANIISANGVSNFSDWTAGTSLLSPTAANADISGRVVNTHNRGLENVAVTLSGGSLTEPITVTTNSVGRYRFSEVPAGDTYILTVTSKRHTFAQPSQVFTVNGSLTNLNFVGEGW